MCGGRRAADLTCLVEGADRGGNRSSMCGLLTYGSSIGILAATRFGDGDSADVVL